MTTTWNQKSEGKDSQQIRPHCLGEGSLLWRPTEYKGSLKVFDSLAFYSTYKSDVSLGTLTQAASIL